MIRTLVVVACLTAAVLWLPVWGQVLMLIAGFLLARYKVALLVPAIISDVLYAPTGTLAVGNLKATLLVGIILIAWYSIATQTRFGYVA